jgi:hypothetical protein
MQTTACIGIVISRSLERWRLDVGYITDPESALEAVEEAHEAVDLSHFPDCVAFRLDLLSRPVGEHPSAVLARQ